MPSSGPSTQLTIIYSDASVLVTVLDLAAEFGLSAINAQYPDSDMRSPEKSKVVLSTDGTDISDEVIGLIKVGIEELHGLDCTQLRVCPKSHSVEVLEVHFE